MCCEFGTENIESLDILPNIANLSLCGIYNSVSDLHIMKSAINPVYLKSLMPFYAGFVFYSLFNVKI